MRGSPGSHLLKRCDREPRRRLGGASLGRCGQHDARRGQVHKVLHSAVVLDQMCRQSRSHQHRSDDDSLSHAVQQMHRQIPRLEIGKDQNIRVLFQVGERKVLCADLTSQRRLEFSDGERRNIAAAFRPLLPAFHQYLFVGGFPETALSNDMSLAQRLLREDVVERVLRRDMVALFGVRNVEELERLFLYLCFNSGGIVAVNTVASELGTTKTTVANHLDVLERAHLIYRLSPIATGGKKILKAKQKILHDRCGTEECCPHAVA